MKNKIYKEIASLLSVSIFDKGLVLIKGYFLLYYLNPAEYGLINIINQVKNLAKYSDLGFNSVVERDYSFYININPNEARRIRNLGYTLELGLSLIFFVALFLISFKYCDNETVFIGIIFAAIAFLFQKIINIYKTDFKISIRFLTFSKINLIQSIVLNISIIFGVIYFGIYAPLIVPAFALFFVTLYLYKSYNLNYKFYFNYKKFKRIIGTSIKIGGLTVLTGIGIYLERFYILEKYNLEAVGFFGVVFFIITTFQMVVYDIARPYMPRSREAIGNGDFGYLKTSVLRPTLISIPCLSAIIILSYYIFPILIDCFLAKYSLSISILISMLPMIYYVGVSSFSGYILYSKGIDDFVSIYMAMASYIMVMGICFFIIEDEVISFELIGLSFSISMFFKSFITLFGSLKLFFGKFMAFWYSFLINILPFIIMSLLSDEFLSNVLFLFYNIK